MSTRKLPISAQRALLADTRGAAYVEFLIAFLPVFVLFLCAWQFGRIFTVRLLCTHAAVVGARSAAVIVAEPEENGSVEHRVTDDKKQQISIAVFAALAPALVNDWIASVDVQFPSTAGGSPDTPVDLQPDSATFSNVPPKMIHVRVVAAFRCGLPFADALMCDHSSQSGYTFPITAEATFPYQSARYAYDPPSPPQPTELDTAGANP